MRINIFKSLMLLLLFSALLSSCIQDSKVGPQGPQGLPGSSGLDGQVNIYYSKWITPSSWYGITGDWYFDDLSPDISQDIVEAGIILAYMSVPGDLYVNAVRPLPAYAIGSNWDFLIPDYGKIEFTCDSQNLPGTIDYFFRYVLIPSGTQLKSTKSSNLTKDELMKMPYSDVCKLLGIPE